VQALQDWQEKCPRLFKKKVYNLTGLDDRTVPDVVITLAVPLEATAGITVSALSTTSLERSRPVRWATSPKTDSVRVSSVGINGLSSLGLEGGSPGSEFAAHAASSMALSPLAA
jgi:hypothetical protein